MIIYAFGLGILAGLWLALLLTYLVGTDDVAEDWSDILAASIDSDAAHFATDD